MKSHKIRQIFETVVQTKVVQGKKSGFVLYFFMTHTINLARRIFKKIPNRIYKILDKSNKEFIIQNSIGKFAVRPFNDSFTISAPYFESELQGWVDLPSQKRIAIDIGANIGRYTLLASTARYQKIIAIEANPITFGVLKANIHINGLDDKVTSIQKAVGDRLGMIHFEVDKHHLGGGRVIQGEGTNPIWETVFSVELIPVDTLLDNQHISYSEIDFVKIDVEGFEMEVLLGMQKTLATMQAGSHLMIEISSINRDRSISLIQNSGFSLIESKNCDYLFKKNT